MPALIGRRGRTRSRWAQGREGGDGPRIGTGAAVGAAAAVPEGAADAHCVSVSGALSLCVDRVYAGRLGLWARPQPLPRQLRPGAPALYRVAQLHVPLEWLLSGV